MIPTAEGVSDNRVCSRVPVTVTGANVVFSSVAKAVLDMDDATIAQTMGLRIKLSRKNSYPAALATREKPQLALGEDWRRA